jgi:molecular chaperone GrpE
MSDDDGTAGPSGRQDEEREREPDQQLLRALADLDNLRKRYGRELDRERDAERERVAREWLPVVDNLERSLEFAKADDDPMVAGVRAVLEQAVSVLARIGFPRFDDIGEVFDPARHEALSAVPSDETPGTIVATVHPGYGEGSSMLRPARVVVAQERAAQGQHT